MMVEKSDKTRNANTVRMNAMAKMATGDFELPFKNERRIILKKVCTLPDTFIEPPSHNKVLAWVHKGVRGNRLEAHREGGVLYTSIEAVHRFIERGNRRG